MIVACYRFNNDWSSKIIPLFFRPKGYSLHNLQILLRVMFYVQDSFDKKQRRENVDIKWKKGIMGTERSIVGVEDDGKNTHTLTHAHHETPSELKDKCYSFKSYPRALS